MKYVDEYNQMFATLEAMGEKVQLPDALEAPLFLASFGTDSPYEAAIAFMLVQDDLNLWEALISDLILTVG